MYAALLWPAGSGGAHAGWPLVITQLCILTALLLWMLGLVDSGQLEWRRTALDLPLALLIALVLLQLAVGNRPLRQWALAPPTGGADALPGRFLLLGTVAPSQTARSLLLFLSYVGVYVLVVNLIRYRRELDRLVRVLLIAGSVLAFFSIVDFLFWEAWMIMLICLGIGYLAGRRGTERPRGPRTFSGSARRREERLRQYLPLFGLTLMALATVLTLSRGALLAVLAAGVMLFTALARVRGRRWVLGFSAVLGAVTLTFALWIGVEPLLARLAHSEHVGRLEQRTAENASTQRRP